MVSAASDVAAATVISAGPASPCPLVSLASSLAYPLTPDPSSLSLSLFFFILSLSFHPFLQSFLLFLLLSFVGLSCKCSCWPPILVVLRSLPKSSKRSLVVYPSLSVCVHRGEPVVDLSFLSLSLPQIPRVSKRGILHSLTPLCTDGKTLIYHTTCVYAGLVQSKLTLRSFIFVYARQY